jgi:hypothetical protein
MLVEEGQLKGAFVGFKDQDVIFEFNCGGRWRQTQYKYLYHYAYMPRAKVIEYGGRYLLEVEGIAAGVEVRRA